MQTATAQVKRDMFRALIAKGDAEAQPVTLHPKRTAPLTLLEQLEQSYWSEDGNTLFVPTSGRSGLFYRITLKHCSCPAKKRCKHFDVLFARLEMRLKNIPMETALRNLRKGCMRIFCLSCLTASRRCPISVTKSEHYLRSIA